LLIGRPPAWYVLQLKFVLQVSIAYHYLRRRSCLKLGSGRRGGGGGWEGGGGGGGEAQSSTNVLRHLAVVCTTSFSFSIYNRRVLPVLCATGSEQFCFVGAHKTYIGVIELYMVYCGLWRVPGFIRLPKALNSFVGGVQIFRGLVRLIEIIVPYENPLD